MLAVPQKQSATDTLTTTSKTVIKKTADAIRDLIGNKIANKIAKVSKNLEIVTNQNDKENLKKDICLQKKDKEGIIDDLDLNNIITMEYQKILNF